MERFTRLDRLERVDRLFRRFGPAHRIEHGVLLLAVVLLAITGLPQKFASWGLSVTLIGWLGGIQTVRLIHRGAAIALLAEGLFHLIGTIYRFNVLRQPPHIVLLMRDLRHLWQGLKYRWGRASELPDMGRFTYQEKLLYWAVAWSVLMLSISGLLLWKPVLATQLLPGQSIPAAKTIHGAEAIFLLLIGLGWHVWHTAVQQGNWSIFSGSIREDVMLEEHPLEWSAIMDHKDQLPLDLLTTLRRRRQFMLFAALLTIIIGGGLVAYLGSQPTAVVTREARQVIEVDPGAGLPDVTALPSPTYPVMEWIDVQPLFVEHCAACHGRRDELPLTGYEALIDRGMIVPGDVRDSLIVQVMGRGDHPGQFPADALGLVVTWIDGGARR